MLILAHFFPVSVLVSINAGLEAEVAKKLVSVLVLKKLCGLGLERLGLDYSPDCLQIKTGKIGLTA